MIARNVGARGVSGSRDLRDETVVRLVDHSAVARIAQTIGRRLGQSWRDSRSARVLSGAREQWVALPSDRRVGAAALVLLVAVVVHVWMTGFAAPEPTWLARAAWMGIIAVLLTAMVGARHVAAAWADRSSRHNVGDESERE